MSIEKEKRKGQPQQTYLTHLSILLLMMGIICGVWFVVDWFQLWIQPHELARYATQDEIDRALHDGSKFGEFMLITSVESDELNRFLLDNFEVGISSREDVLMALPIQYVEPHSWTSQIRNECSQTSAPPYDYTVICTIFVNRSLYHDVHLYYFLTFIFDDQQILKEKHGCYIGTSMSSRKMNSFLGMASVVFLLGALGAGWRFRVHRRNLTEA